MFKDDPFPLNRGLGNLRNPHPHEVQDALDTNAAQNIDPALAGNTDYYSDPLNQVEESPEWFASLFPTKSDHIDQGVAERRASLEEVRSRRYRSGSYSPPPGMSASDRLKALRQRQEQEKAKAEEFFGGGWCREDYPPE